MGGGAGGLGEGSDSQRGLGREVQVMIRWGRGWGRRVQVMGLAVREKGDEKVLFMSEQSSSSIYSVSLDELGLDH